MSDAVRYPHVYVGPTTKWGLRNGEPCRISGGATGGGKTIVTMDGRRWVVGPSQVERARL